MNYKVIPKPDKRIESAKQSLFVKGASFCNRNSRSRTPIKDSDARKTTNDKNYTKHGEASNDIVRTCKIANVSILDPPNTCLPKGKELKRSKSDVSLKSRSRMWQSKTCKETDVNDKKRLSSALKRKESITRRDIISDQCDQAVDNVKGTSKFKLDVKVGVRNEHYNQWARSKRSVSVSLAPAIGREEIKRISSPPYSARYQEVQMRRSSGVIRKGSASNSGMRLLNFENFKTIFNNLPARKIRIPTKRGLGASSACVSKHNPVNIDLREVMELRENLQIDGTRVLTTNEDIHRNNSVVPRISVGNVLQGIPTGKNTDRISNGNTDYIDRSCEDDQFQLNDSNGKYDDNVKAHRNVDEIIAVCDANTVDLKKLGNETCSSDEEFDKTPLIDGKTVNKSCDTELEKDFVVPREIDGKKYENQSKIPFIPIKQNIFSSFKLEADNPLRYVIRNDLYRLSKDAEVLSATHRIVSKYQVNASDKLDDKQPRNHDTKQAKIQLKLSTQSPILTTQNVVSNFPKLRIEQHLQNLKMRTESQQSTRNSPSKTTNSEKDNVPAFWDGRSQCNKGIGYKQQCVSINEQVQFNSKQSVGHLSVKINCSATNLHKLRNANKIGEIIPLEKLSMDRTIWNLNNMNVL